MGSQHGMRIRVLSDLHLEFMDWNPPKAGADVVGLAGDIHVGVVITESLIQRMPGRFILRKSDGSAANSPMSSSELRS